MILLRTIIILLLLSLLPHVAHPRPPDDQTQKRTLFIVQHRSELGRMILLICPRACKPERTTIPQWVRDFNEEHDYSAEELIFFHYHNSRTPPSFLNITVVDKQPIVLHIAAGKTLKYEGNLDDQAKFTKWLEALDQTRIARPSTAAELDIVLDKVRQCEQSFLLVVHNPKVCNYEYWKNAARVVHSSVGIATVYLEQPMENELSVTLFKRLSSLTPTSCAVISLLHDNQYTDLTRFKPEDLVIDIETILNGSTCYYDDDAFTMKGVRSPLTDLQMEYYVTDVDLKRLEHKTAYIAVGLAGGIAVVALAISIFWGLNGSAFTKS